MSEPLKLCPFCGGDAILEDFKGPRGGGDFQQCYVAKCKNQCRVGPAIGVGGQHGYYDKDDIKNEEAKALAIKTWNTRM